MKHPVDVARAKVFKTTFTLDLTSRNLVEQSHFYSEAPKPSKNTFKNFLQLSKIRYDMSYFQI